MGFPGGTSCKEPTANAEDTRDASLVPGLGGSPGGAPGNPLLIPAWRIPWTGAWRATVHGVAKWDTLT